MRIAAARMRVFTGLILTAVSISDRELSSAQVSTMDQPEVRVESTDSVGPRALEPQTKSAVIRDYLQAWRSMSQALASNQPGPLDATFVGVAKEKLANTLRDQQQCGVRAVYRDRAHDIHLIFYSPEGLSIQLLDIVEYDVQVVHEDRTLATEHMHVRYVAVLTPTEVRWKVRILQAEPD